MGVVGENCRMHGRGDNHVQQKRHLDIDGRIILKRTLKNDGVTVEAGLNWLKTGR
jgi:hypothetical protein